jgi:ankyrin repeat protein
MNLHESLMTAVVAQNVDEVKRIIESGLDLNARCDQGASVLFGAILCGNAPIVLHMLEHGADPNLIADEPAASIYTEKPLNLARQCRFLMDWDKYDPIVRLLERFGATDIDGEVHVDNLDEIERRAKAWQSVNRQS